MPMPNNGCSHRINKPYRAMNDKEIIFFENKDLERYC